jgi:hypothetical protein
MEQPASAKDPKPVLKVMTFLVVPGMAYSVAAPA